MSKDNRIYNISFDLHTVSGIVISVGLFVIFFAGTFSFFRDEIINWERNEPVTVLQKLNVNVDQALDTAAKQYSLYGRDIIIRRNSDERNVTINIEESKDTTDTKEGEYYYLDSETYHMATYEERFSLGEFLYRLHFFAQIPYPVGYYLSGFVALFFLFAIVTGIIVHWEKIIKNFYLFRPWAKLKTMWTDAHTVLGTIGLPFQAVYAVTGAYFMIRIFLLIPTVLVLYNGDAEKIYDDLGVDYAHFNFENKRLDSIPELNSLIARTEATWENFTVTQMNISNYGDKGMYVGVMGELDKSDRFTGNGEVIYSIPDMQVARTKDPFDNTYVDGVVNTLTRLHYGDYGGMALKVVYFILGLISCFVILSGVLLWIEARRKPHIPEKKRRFNERVGHIYLAICLTMFPVTAFSFIVVRFIPNDWIQSTYFITWLLAIVFFTIKKDNAFTNRYSLLAGTVLGFIIPIVSLITTGSLWLVDIIWISLSITGYYALYRLRVSTHDSPSR